ELAAQADLEERCRPLDEMDHVAGHQTAVGLLLEAVLQPGQLALDIAPIAVEPTLVRPLRLHLLLCQRASEAALDARRALLGRRLLHVLPQRDTFEEPAHDIEDFVYTHLAPDALHLLQQRLHHATLARLAGDQIADDDGIVALAEAMDAPHALLKAGGVPGEGVVDHQPAELQVDALARCIGGDEVAGATLPQLFAEV